MLSATSYLSGQTGGTPSTLIEAPPQVPLIFIVIVEQGRAGRGNMTIAHTPSRCCPPNFSRRCGRGRAGERSGGKQTEGCPALGAELGLGNALLW